MVYSRYVEKYGPYLYRSKREGETVKSIYVGKGANTQTTQANLTPHIKKEPEHKTEMTSNKDKDVNPFAAPTNKPLEPPKPEKKKIQVEHKTKEETNLTYLERAHLLAYAKKYNIDRAEIDHKLSYEENKIYLDQLAKENSISQDDKNRADLEVKEWSGKYKDFLDDVKEDSEKWKDYF
jgi:hypothetical protein